MSGVKHVKAGFDRAALAGIRIDCSQAIGPQIYAALRRRIVDGRLPAATPIHENDIAALCFVSRTPVRSSSRRPRG